MIYNFIVRLCKFEAFVLYIRFCFLCLCYTCFIIVNPCLGAQYVSCDVNGYSKTNIAINAELLCHKYKMIDLFAGIGGMRIGFELTGRSCCVFTSEWDSKCRETYLANWPGSDIKGDIRKVNPVLIPDFDILCAGFPCQPFSSIGKREGFEHQTQGTLFFNIAKIIKEKRPKAFLLENVPGILTHDKGSTLAIICDILRRDLGYEMDYWVLDAADFGLPQYRKRVFFVGFRGDLGVKVCGVDSGKNTKVCAYEAKNKRFVFPIGEFKDNHVGFGCFMETNAIGPSVSLHLQTNYLFKVNDGRPQIVDASTTFPVKTLCASYHKVQRLTGTFVRGGKTGIRLFTENECKALQGFPKDFKIPVSRPSMYRQFGNAVAVPVVQAIAKEMILCLDSALSQNESH